MGNGILRPPPLPSFPNGGSIVSVTFEPMKICLRTEVIPGWGDLAA